MFIATKIKKIKIVERLYTETNSHKKRKTHKHTPDDEEESVVFIFSEVISNHFVFNLVLQREEGGTDCTDKRKGKMRCEKE